MITKQQWDEYRKAIELPMFIIYDFYVENRNKDRRVMSVQEFERFLPQFIQEYEGVELIIDKKKRVKVTYQVIAYKVSRFYEEKYYPEEINPGNPIIFNSNIHFSYG